MTRAEQILPGRVPVPCWRCGHDTSAGFDLLRIGGRNVAVHKRGDVTCVPTLHRPAAVTPHAKEIP